MSPNNEIRTLIVDDSAKMRDALRLVLVGIRGCDVVGEAPNGLDAIELARTLRPSLVVMDVHMPIMDGLEALRVLKRDLPSTHVVMVSTQLDPEVGDEAKNVGADACLEKGPELSDELSAMVLKLVQDLPS